ncbi:MAG: hypothetical protein HXX19_12945, partial [Rhodoferax sp.]|nr:hypothetical protein [Rhodoferax sp.]
INGGKIPGGLAGQNTLALGATQGQAAGQAYIGLGLFGNTSNEIFGAVYDLGKFTHGWANQYHNDSPPLIMG